MEIINNKLNSLPEQVEENMLNIQKLAEYLKEAYKTSSQLTTSTISIAISDTNAPTSVIDGWLLDSRGLLFKINGGDGTNLLLEFYTDLKGLQGEQGIPGASSNDKGVYITHTMPTLDGGNYIIDKTDIENISRDDITIQINDILIYIDSNNEPTHLFKIIVTSDTNLTLSLQGNYAKGKPLYQHNIQIGDINAYNIHFQIITDSDVSMNINDVYRWLLNNGFVGGSGTSYRYAYLYVATGNLSTGHVIGVQADIEVSNKILIYTGSGTNSDTTITRDEVIAL